MSTFEPLSHSSVVIVFVSTYVYDCTCSIVPGCKYGKKMHAGGYTGLHGQIVEIGRDAWGGWVQIQLKFSVLLLLPLRLRPHGRRALLSPIPGTSIKYNTSIYSI